MSSSKKGIKRKRSPQHTPRVVSVGDLSFSADMPGTNYEAKCNIKMTASDLYSIFRTDESAILFCAREGWIDLDAPTCQKVSRNSKRNTTSYLYKRKGGVWTWRFRCCKTTQSIFMNSMFYQSTYGPAKVLEMMFYMAARVH